MTGLTGVTAIIAGREYSCALKRNGTVACWGDNSFGQLGDGTTTNRLTPTLVTGLTGVTAITAGSDHACALKQNGNVDCWETTPSGQLPGTAPPPKEDANPVTGISGARVGSMRREHSVCVPSRTASRPAGDTTAPGRWVMGPPPTG
ncbi:MAG: hypothetical protein IPQ14_04080 [Candidatus Microthrix sp.]|uniref:RCC1 domain-containing protein n=1 Tax=Candidatus Neomicrothrix sp. TaxID=2719034 RepID=UPI0025BE1206|nr:hypothetical protein [Candidatus Microthrix sp.]MBL0203519.1 hypothetical protein [Candidatus Microthrix sp.]